MSFRHQRLVRALPVLFVLGCGGSDGGPAEVPVIVLSQSGLSLTEGIPETLTVVLDAVPQANISVALTSAGGVTVQPTSLDFTPANFATPKSVIVTPLQDADLAPGADTVTATATGLGIVKLPVTIADDDSQAVVLDSSQVALVEGDSATYGVRLAYQPLASVNVTLTPSDTLVAVTPTTLNFTPADYATPKTVQVRAKQDVDLHSDTVHVVASVPSGQQASLPVNITDDDVQAFQADTSMVEVTEGDSAQLGIRLAFQPAGNLTIVATSLVPTAVTVNPSSRNFTPANWDTYQYVTVYGSQDVDLNGATISLRLSGGTVANKDVPVHVTDDDVQAIETSVSSVAVTEGATDTVGVRLAFQPGGDVAVSAASANTATATASPSILTFTTSNWATYQYVTVSGTQDNDLVNGSTSLDLTSAGVPGVSVTLNVTDNDTQAFVTSVDTVFVTEGLDATVTITLAFQPPSNVTVLLSTDGLVATVNPTVFSSLTPANYTTGFTAIIHGTEDANTVTDGTLLTIQATGVPAKSILVIVADND